MYTSPPCDIRMMFMIVIMMMIFIFMEKAKRDQAKFLEDRRKNELKGVRLEKLEYDSSHNPGIVFL